MNRRLHYNRAINLPRYPFMFFRYEDLIIAGCITIGALMLVQSFLLGFSGATLYGMYLAILRAGRPMGHDMHFWRAHLTPKVLRAGQIPFRPEFFVEEQSPKTRKGRK